MLTLAGTSERINVFEGMTNFLSALKERTVVLKDHNLILNSLAMTRRLIQKLETLIRLRSGFFWTSVRPETNTPEDY